MELWEPPLYLIVPPSGRNSGSRARRRKSSVSKFQSGGASTLVSRLRTQITEGELSVPKSSKSDSRSVSSSEKKLLHKYYHTLRRQVESKNQRLSLPSYYLTFEGIPEVNSIQRSSLSPASNVCYNYSASLLSLTRYFDVGANDFLVAAAVVLVHSTIHEDDCFSTLGFPGSDIGSSRLLGSSWRSNATAVPSSSNSFGFSVFSSLIKSAPLPESESSQLASSTFAIVSNSIHPSSPLPTCSSSVSSNFVSRLRVTSQCRESQFTDDIRGYTYNDMPIAVDAQ